MLDTIITVALQARVAAARLARKPPSVGAALRRLACPEQHEAADLAEARLVVEARLDAALTMLAAAPADAADALLAERHRAAGERARLAVGYALLVRAMDGDAFAADALRAHVV
jgi:hypothetical protein